MVAAWLDTLNVSGLDEALECRGVGFLSEFFSSSKYLLSANLQKQGNPPWRQARFE